MTGLVANRSGCGSGNPAVMHGPQATVGSLSREMRTAEGGSMPPGTDHPVGSTPCRLQITSSTMTHMGGF